MIKMMSLPKKMVPIFSVALFFIVATLFISSAYKPRGKAALEAQMEEKRNALKKMETQMQANRQEVEALEQKLGLNSAKGQTTSSEIKYNVSVQPLATSSIRDEIMLPACLEAQSDVRLAAKSDGAIEWVGVQDGQPVKKGQLLAKIDAGKRIQEVNRAESAERLAHVNLQRIESLVKQKVSSAGELDSVRSQWEQTKAALALTRQMLADSNVVSPIDGILDDIIPDVGEYVHAGDAVARIVDISTVKACVNVPEKDISFFQIGQATQVELPEQIQLPKSSGRFTPGKISNIRTVAEDQSKTFRMEITVGNTKSIFRPGMISRVKMLRREHANAIVVPFFAVLQTQDGAIAYVENGGIAKLRKLNIGIRQGMMLEVTEGLSAGDRLIVSGQRTLSDGASVLVVEMKS